MPNKEYYEAKAELCRNLAIKQLEAGSGEGAKNLLRMVNALTMANLIEKEEDSEQTPSIL